MSDFAWISTAPAHASNLRPLRHSFSETEQKSFGIECGEKNIAGETLGPDCFPEEIYGAPNAKEKDYKLPDIFYAGSYWAVSKNAADVLRQFDLGGGGLFPVKVLKNDRQTPIDGDWFCINFGNRKDTFLPADSQNIRPFVRDIYSVKATSTDGDLALSSAALSGPDIWIEPKIFSAIFLSPALGAALKKAKADKGFFLKKCRVI